MIDTLFVVNCLDSSGTAKVLYFSKFGYINGSNVLYKNRIARSALVNVSPNDGGTLGIFNSSSVGEIEVDNSDGSYDYLNSYYFDGRVATIVQFDGTTSTEIFNGIITNVSDSGNNKVFSLKLQQENLKDFPLDTYDGSNSPPLGLEGTADSIKDRVKPKVFGPNKNITPVLVNESLLIYQVSSRDDCIITAVYDQGIPLSNFVTASAHSIGDTSISLKYFGTISAGQKIVFSNHNTVYEVDESLSGGVLTIPSPGLTAAVPKRTGCEVVNFYTDSVTDLQYVNYFVDADTSVGGTTIVVEAGLGTGVIDIGDQVSFGSHKAIYEVSVALASGSFEISTPLIDNLYAGDSIMIIGTHFPSIWGSYQGFLRLNSSPYGDITCDVITVDSLFVSHKAGDVLNNIVVESGLTLDSSYITLLNGIDYLGVNIQDTISIVDVINNIAKSLAFYYHISSSAITLYLLDVPKVTEDFQITKFISIDRQNAGDADGIPYKSITFNYDKNETVQSSLDTNTPRTRRQWVSKQFRTKKRNNSITAARHLNSTILTIESLIKSSASAIGVLDRIAPLVTVRRDLVDVSIQLEDLYDLSINSTIKLITDIYGYSSGRNMILVGYEIDDDNNTAKLRLYG